MKNELVIFENQNVKLEVNVKDETVWLSLDQMAKLFNRDKSVVSRHISNIFKEGELSDDSTVAKFATVQKEKDRLVNRNIDYYNLDVIISVGYRVKSKEGTTFRKWANKILKDYLIKGYAVNQKRLEYLEKKVQLIDIAGRIDANLAGEEVKDIIKVINNYKEALDLLDDYDHKKIIKPNGLYDDKKITYEECIKIINKLKFNNDSNIFALERDKGLEAIIGNIYQTFDGEDVYKTIEEKAANFLYLITKNHVFIDGNKRIAATLFIYFLDFYNILYYEGKEVIDNNTLAAITLLIAESNPNEKSILISLVMNFLKRGDFNE
ncbi:MAG: RhuM family protein [Erysipelotrichaceae bacterium]